jgi:hypothetical protein
VWQELSRELPLAVVTVALDSDPAAARPWIDKARPTHPSLIDSGHTLDDLFGIVNVPSGVWIDEHGVVVRGPETAYTRRPAFLDTSSVPEVRALRIDADGYMARVREWASTGRCEPKPLAPRTLEESTAAAHFEMALYLHGQGMRESALSHFAEAVRLQPRNWTYKRQAWKFGLPGDWLAEVRKIGPENYY